MLERTFLIGFELNTFQAMCDSAICTIPFSLSKPLIMSNQLSSDFIERGGHG